MSEPPSIPPSAASQPQLPPLQWPMPVEPLRYETPYAGGRPGILVAVGVMSIIVACIGALYAVIAVIYAFALGSLATFAAASAVPPPVSSAPPAMMAPAQRQVVCNVFASRHQLAPKRREMLELLCAQAGDDLFPISASSPDFTAARIRAGISDAGQVPGVGGTVGNDFFIVARGRIELADDHAVFRQSTGAVTRVFRDDPNNPDISDSIYAASAASAVPTTAPVFSPTTATSTTVASPFPFTAAAVRPIALMLGIDAVVSGGLAILLFVSGILALTRSRLARRLHLIYAVIKLPATIIMALAMASAASWLFSSIFAGSPSASSATYFYTLGPAVIGCLYPIALLIVMNTRTVRGYYGAGAAADAIR